MASKKSLLEQIGQAAVDDHKAWQHVGQLGVSLEGDSSVTYEQFHAAGDQADDARRHLGSLIEQYLARYETSEAHNG